MQIIKGVREMQKISSSHLRENKRIAFVPTMGFLHNGHLRLVDVAAEYGDIVVVSIFVNPIQFGPKEDFSRYPRDIISDLKKLKAHKTDIVFIPEVSDIYPEGYQTYIDVVDLSKPLCGRFRPGHFRGVATIVAKLFNIIRPDYAIFGKKDYQQLMIIKRMVKDLNFNIRIVGVDTVREPDLLAMSSRNSYLSQEERKIASHFAEALYISERLYRSGKFKRPSEIVGFVKDYLRRFKSIKLQYVEILSANDLKEVSSFQDDMVLASAVFVGKTRLIDNRVLRRRCR